MGGNQRPSLDPRTPASSPQACGGLERLSPSGGPVGHFLLLLSGSWGSEAPGNHQQEPLPLPRNKTGLWTPCLLHHVSPESRARLGLSEVFPAAQHQGALGKCQQRKAGGGRGQTWQEAGTSLPREPESHVCVLSRACTQEQTASLEVTALALFYTISVISELSSLIFIHLGGKESSARPQAHDS